MDKDKSGIAFEKAVVQLQQMLDPNSEVTHNEQLRDRLGHSRQFDVVVRGKVGGHPVLAVIECKDLKRKVGNPDIEAFITKTRDLRADIAIIASRKGFTQPALEKAADHGIGAVSLLSDFQKGSGFTIGHRCFAEVFRWSQFKINFGLVSKKPIPETLGANEVTWKGFPILNWFLKYLLEEMPNERETGWHQLSIEFPKVRYMYIGNHYRAVNSVTFHALRERKLKTKWISIEGDAMVRWDTYPKKVGGANVAVILPPGGTITTVGFRSDFSDWDDYDGDEMPASEGPMDFRFVAFQLPYDSDIETVEL